MTRYPRYPRCPRYPRYPHYPRYPRYPRYTRYTRYTRYPRYTAPQLGILEHFAQLRRSHVAHGVHLIGVRLQRHVRLPHAHSTRRMQRDAAAHQSAGTGGGAGGLVALGPRWRDLHKENVVDLVFAPGGLVAPCEDIGGPVMETAQEAEILVRHLRWLARASQKPPKSRRRGRESSEWRHSDPSTAPCAPHRLARSLTHYDNKPVPDQPRARAEACAAPRACCQACRGQRRCRPPQAHGRAAGASSRRSSRRWGT